MEHEPKSPFSGDVEQIDIPEEIADAWIEIHQHLRNSFEIEHPLPTFIGASLIIDIPPGSLTAEDFATLVETLTIQSVNLTFDETEHTIVATSRRLN